jgi:hydrogenase maturation protease
MLVIGAGNTDRRDDGAGPELACRLLLAANRSFDVATCSGEATALMRLFAARDHVEIVDACVSGATPGVVMRFDVSASPVPAQLKAVSSHGFGVAEAVELARVLGQLPRTVILHAIEAGDIGMGQGLTPAVETAVARLVRDILR